MISIRRHRRAPKPLRGVIDVYKCLSCGSSIAVNADSRTFSSPPPLGCKQCPNQPDMQAGRYYSTDNSGWADGDSASPRERSE